MQYCTCWQFFFLSIFIRECHGIKTFFQKSNMWWLQHASPQQLLLHFATFSQEMMLVEEGRASKQPLLCRMHSVKLWLFRREKQKATAPVLNIVSFLSVSFSFYLPLLLCLVILLLLCLYSTLTPSLFACWCDWQCERREESAPCATHGRAVLLEHMQSRAEGSCLAQTFLKTKARTVIQQENV